ncbi:MAG: hypothetical protein Q9219_004794 [cf. Caloplaca sp. 3 TL-2023]
MSFSTSPSTPKKQPDDSPVSLVSVSIPIQRSHSSEMPPPPIPLTAGQPQARKRAARDTDSEDTPGAQSSDQGSSQKRRDTGSLKSQTSSRFSESVKRKVREASSGQDCWHCEAVGRDVAHVIPKHDSAVSNFISDPVNVERFTNYAEGF